jgi:hypothetical protein
VVVMQLVATSGTGAETHCLSLGEGVRGISPFLFASLIFVSMVTGRISNPIHLLVMAL